MWVMPASIAALGDQQRVRYDGTGPWIGQPGCGGSFKPGAVALKAYIMTYFRGVSEIGGYHCRPNTANTSETSVHGTGRALDIMIPTVGGRADTAVGDLIANWLVANAQAIGIQYVLWNGMQWSPSHNPKFRRYTAANQHVDHIHTELTIAGSLRQTPFFNGMIAQPPSVPGEGVDGPSAVATLVGISGAGLLGYGLYKILGRRT